MLYKPTLDRILIAVWRESTKALKTLNNHESVGFVETFTLYIGSNNTTKKLELKKIEAILSRRHDGFTISRAVGHWRGSKESTAVVSLAADRLAALASIADLKAELHQEAVAYQVAPEMVFA